MLKKKYIELAIEWLGPIALGILLGWQACDGLAK